MNFSQGYQQLWKAIIRPPRAQYRDEMLGPKVFKCEGLKVERTDVELVNKRGHKIKCSHFQPHIRPAKQLPCVIYLHGNSSCRIEGRSYIPYILCHDITLFTFDFSGCGNSEGEYISLGFYEKDDVQTVFQYLRSLGTVSSIGLWGRSMGAVTALMYADKNPQIACIVCDSPFSNLEKLCKELAQKFANGFISFFSGIALSFIASTIKEKNNFDISALDPLGKHVKKAYIPAFFIAAKGDSFIIPKHTQKLYQAYAGQKKKMIVEGDHNSERDKEVNDAISIFFYNNLHVQQLVVPDQKYMEEQKASKKKENKSEQKQIVQQNIFDGSFNQDRILEYIMKLSLEEFQKNKNSGVKKEEQKNAVSQQKKEGQGKELSHRSGQKTESTGKSEKVLLIQEKQSMDNYPNSTRPKQQQKKNKSPVKLSQENISQQQMDERLLK